MDADFWRSTAPERVALRDRLRKVLPKAVADLLAYGTMYDPFGGYTRDVEEWAASQPETAMECGGCMFWIPGAVEGDDCPRCGSTQFLRKAPINASSEP